MRSTRFARLTSLMIAFFTCSSLILPAKATPLPKPGFPCTKIGQVKKLSGLDLKCVSNKGKLIWTKSLSRAAQKQKIEIPNAGNSNKPLPVEIITTPIPVTPKDFLDFRSSMIYGVKNGMLTRKADSGTFYEEDSRKEDAFESVRIRAFDQLKKTSQSREHPKVEFQFGITSNFPDFLIEYTKRELDEIAADWNDFFKEKITVQVWLVTEKDRDFIKSNQWLQQNLPNIFNRFDNRKERPFISGGGGYWLDNNGLNGKIYLATASYLDLNYVNYEWPEVAKHEFVHVIQDYAFYQNNPRRNHELLASSQPFHFREGGANTIAYLTAFRNRGWSSDAMDWLVWQRARDGSSWKRIKSLEDAVALMRETKTASQGSAFELSYALGAVMNEWFISEYGISGFQKLLHEMSTKETYDEALKSAVGISEEQFYAAVAPYVLSVWKRTDPYFGI